MANGGGAAGSALACASGFGAVSGVGAAFASLTAVAAGAVSAFGAGLAAGAAGAGGAGGAMDLGAVWGGKGRKVTDEALAGGVVVAAVGGASSVVTAIAEALSVIAAPVIGLTFGPLFDGSPCPGSASWHPARAASSKRLNRIRMGPRHDTFAWRKSWPQRPKYARVSSFPCLQYQNW